MLFLVELLHSLLLHCLGIVWLLVLKLLLSVSKRGNLLLKIWHAWIRKAWIWLGCQRIAAVHATLLLLPLDLFHDWTTDFACGSSTLALANSVVIQDASTTQTVRGFAVLVAALLHVFPESHHLLAKLGLAIRSFLALGGVPKKQETLLLLSDNFLLLCSQLVKVSVFIQSSFCTAQT